MVAEQPHTTQHQRRGPSKTAKVNIRDIAKAAGVSVATVSRVINNGPKASEATRKRVNETIERLGYVPNAHALALTTQSNSVTMVVNAITDGTYAQMMAGVESEAAERGMTFSVITSGGDRVPFSDIVTELISSRPRVAVIVAHSAGEQETDRILIEALPQFENVGTKVVMLGRQRLSLPADVGVVDYANERGMHEITQYMVSMGHRSFIYIGVRGGSSVFEARYRGFLKALQEAGIEHDPNVDIQKVGTREAMVAEILSRYASGEKYTANVASTDEVALDTIVALRAAGLSIPKQSSVVGFDDMRFAEDLFVPLTTVHVPFEEMGRVAVQMGLGEKGQDIQMPTYVVSRKSVLPPPQL